MKNTDSQEGELELNIPRDRNGTFEPQLIGKREKTLKGFYERIVSFYSRGLTTRDIQKILRTPMVSMSPPGSFPR